MKARTRCRRSSTRTWKPTARSPGAPPTGASTSAPAPRPLTSSRSSSPTCSRCIRNQIHVFSEFVGGGFGGKQELLTEDLCVLAALKTGRPVKWEFTRSEEFTAAVSRHPMKITIKLGAKQDGTLTAMQIHTVSNTGSLRQPRRRGPGLVARLVDGHLPLRATRRGPATRSTRTRCPRAPSGDMARRNLHSPSSRPSTNWAASWASTHSRSGART